VKCGIYCVRGGLFAIRILAISGRENSGGGAMPLLSMEKFSTWIGPEITIVPTLRDAGVLGVECPEDLLATSKDR